MSTEPRETCFVGIDVGTSGTKVIAVSPDGTVLGSSSSPHTLRTPRPGWVEQDPDDWWRATTAAVRAVVVELPNGPGQVAAIGLSGHMSSFVPLDIDHRPVRPCIVLSDSRARAEAAWLDECFGTRVERLCGSRPTAATVASRLVWLRRHEPESYARMATFVFAKDYVRLLLTERLASEVTDAGNTMLIDVAAGRWDEQLVRDIGVDPAKLPALVPTTAVAGRVTAKAAAATGLTLGTPVIAGAADQAATIVGSGAVMPGVVAITIGTAAPVITSFRSLPDRRHGEVTFHAHPVPGSFYSIGSVFSGGVSLRWIADATMAASVGGRADLAHAYQTLSAEAAAAPPASDGVLFLPFLVGSGSPDFDGTLRGSFLGLSLLTDRGRLVRAVMEGVAYNVRECIDVFRALGAPVHRLHVGGGGAASATWLAVLAGVLGMPVHPVSVRDMSTLGAAALAAVGLGAFSDIPTASRRLVHYGEPIGTGGDAAIAAYERGYLAYRQARLALRPFYRAQLDQPDAAQGKEVAAEVSGAEGHW
jgi:xylulokinase